MFKSYMLYMRESYSSNILLIVFFFILLLWAIFCCEARTQDTSQQNAKQRRFSEQNFLPTNKQNFILLSFTFHFKLILCCFVLCAPSSTLEQNRLNIQTYLPLPLLAYLWWNTATVECPRSALMINAFGVKDGVSQMQLLKYFICFDFVMLLWQPLPLYG